MKSITFNIFGNIEKIETNVNFNTILEIALDNNLCIPYSCAVGNCGTCKCKLISGKVELLPYSKYALSEQEKQNGFILACRSILINDASVEYYAE